MFFTNKRVLVIGGTGSIGKRLVNDILLENPKVVRIFSRDEYKQFEMEKELHNITNIRFLIGDVRNYDRVLKAMEDIDYIFHAAALKHVPACEYNPYEAVQTNIIGTYNVINAAINSDVKKIVFMSTDKAVSPTNTYGATKLTAERMIAASQYNKGPHKTILSVVRFGNVMGSRGSVIPLFKRQIIEDKKVTITDRRMTRYMMTLEQASKLTIDALKKSKGREIFILKMPVMRLVDLVEVMIEEVCKKYKINKNEIEVEEIGLRPGEKLFEELMSVEEAQRAIELTEMYLIPNILINFYTYNLDAKPKNYKGLYSSDKHNLLNIEQIRDLIVSQNLI